MGNRKIAAIVIIIIMLTLSFLAIRSQWNKFYPETVSFSPDGKYIAIVSKNVMIFEIETGTKIYEFDQQIEFEVSLSWSPKGDMIAFTGQDDYDKTNTVIRVFTVSGDLITTIEFSNIEGMDNAWYERTLSWSSDQSRLFAQVRPVESLGDGPIDPQETYALIDTKTWDIIWQMDHEVVWGHSSIFPNSDLSYFIVMTGGNAELWSLPEGKLVKSFDNGSVVGWLDKDTPIFKQGAGQNQIRLVKYIISEDKWIVPENVKFSLSDPILNYNSTLVTNIQSKETNKIYNIETGELVVRLNITGQTWKGICWETDSVCPIPLNYYWSRYSNLLAHSQYYEDGEYYTLKIFDVDTKEYVIEIGD